MPLLLLLKCPYMVTIKFKPLDTEEHTQILPRRSTTGASGMDTFANVDHVVIPAGGRALIPLGFSVEIPLGYEMQIRPRSGLSIKHGVVAILGTIDSDYRGEVGAILFNMGTSDFHVKRGDRVAQAVIQKIEVVDADIVDDLGETERGSGGFGHTGVGAIPSIIVDGEATESPLTRIPFYPDLITPERLVKLSEQEL